MLAQTGRLPDYVIACVGGGSNAMGIFSAFIEDKQVKLIGVEAAGRGIETGQACRFPGRREGGRAARLQVLYSPDPYGQIQEAYSISAGLDYPGVGPEHSYLKETGRATYVRHYR